MAKPRSVLESMTVTLLEITNEDDSSAGHCSGVMVPSRGKWNRPSTQRNRMKYHS